MPLKDRFGLTEKKFWELALVLELEIVYFLNMFTQNKRDDGPGFVGIRFCPSWYDINLVYSYMKLVFNSHYQS